MATRAEVVDVLDFLAATFMNDKVDEGTIRAWAMHFQNTPRMLLMRAAALWGQNEKWFPKPGELRSVVHCVAAQTNFWTRRYDPWRPPADPRDEAIMWICFRRGCSPDELTQEDLDRLQPPLIVEVLDFAEDPGR